MKKFVQSAIVGATLLVAGNLPAVAADLIAPPPPPPPVVPMGGWYIRGDIGMTNQRLGSLYNMLYDAATTQNLVNVDKNFEAGALYDIGVGYQFNNWLRADAIVQYRGETGFHGLDVFQRADLGGAYQYDNYTAKKSEWLMMANAYVDLGNYYGIVPYVGAGVGASRNTISSFRDMGNDPATGNSTLAYAGAHSKWNFAWALHAGLGFKATDNLTIDLGYSYVDLGDARTGDIIAYDGTNNFYNPMYFRNITSHDVKLGIRYSFN
jgi:opacity protein-like surface antigen